MTWAGKLGPTDLVVDTAGEETLMSAQDHSWQPSLGTRPPFLLPRGWDLLFPQPALDSLELVGRHPVPGREVTCRQNTPCQLAFSWGWGMTKRPLSVRVSPKSVCLFTYRP